MRSMLNELQMQLRINKLGEMIQEGTSIEEELIQIRSYLKDFSNLKEALDESIIIAVTDPAGVITYVNNKFCEISQYQIDELLGKTHRIINSGYHDKSFFQLMWATIQSGKVWSGEVKNKAKDGSPYWVKTFIVPILDECGQVESYLSFRTDITEGKETQEKLYTALQNDFSYVLNTIGNLIVKIGKNAKGEFIYTLAEGKLAEVIGLDKEKLLQRTVHDFFPAELALFLEDKYKRAFKGETLTYDYTLNDLQLMTNLSPIFKDDEVVELIACISDISALHQAQKKAEYLAYYDVVTGLPNRTKFFEDQNVLIQTDYNEKKCYFYLDLDRFKQINDSLGHAIGDEVIKQVAKMLRKKLPEDAAIYRLSGDEFLIVCRIGGVENAVSIGGEILSIFQEAILLPSGFQIFTTASIGISIFSEHGTDVNELLKKADIAMYYAKSIGGNRFHIFSDELLEYDKEVLTINQHLRAAIENNEMELYFQPKYDLSHMRISGMEALLRWRSPILGNVPPDRFIPVAEETGMILDIDKWVLEQACLQNKRWNETIFAEPHRISVNISALHFRLSNFSGIVHNVLNRTGMSPALLELEITEGSVIHYSEESRQCLADLRELGVNVAIDDFGKGYSSLNYLRKFPLYSLKIDRSFIHEIFKNHEDIAIVKAITLLAHELNLKVVAEGIETKEVFEIIRNIGCDEIQGYYISKPLNAKEFVHLYNSIKPSLE